MKKTHLGIALLIMLMLGITSAYAQSEKAAIVLKDLDHPYGCRASSLEPFGVDLYTIDEIFTVANSKGNVKLICYFDLPEDFVLPRAFRESGFDCGIYLPRGDAFTSNTTFVATPGGRAILICEIKASRLR